MTEDYLRILALLVQMLLTPDDCKRPEHPPTIEIREELDPASHDVLTVIRTTSNQPEVELALILDDGKLEIRYAYEKKIVGVPMFHPEPQPTSWFTLHLASYESPWQKRIQEILATPGFDIETFAFSESILCRYRTYKNLVHETMSNLPSTDT